jgi:hypothetical protein
MTALAIPFAQNRLLQQLANAVRNRHRNCILELQIELVEDGIILRGKALSYYGKQIAFHEVRRQLRQAIIANRIQVQDRPVTATTET